MYAFMAMPLFMIQFYRSMMDEDSRLLHLIYQLQLLNLCICGFLQALGVVQLHEMLPLTHVLMLITLLSLLRLLVSWLHSKFRWEARLMLGGFGALRFCCAAGFLDYYWWGRGCISFISVLAYCCLWHLCWQYPCYGAFGR